MASALRHWVKRGVAWGIYRMLPERRIQWVRSFLPLPTPPWESPDSVKRLVEAVQPYTMGDPLKLSVLHGLSCELRRAVPGDIVECGVCRGGSAASLAAGILPDPSRRIWLYDTYEGIPAPTDRDGAGAVHATGTMKGSVEAVQEVLGKVGFPIERAVFRKGLFQETFQEPLPEKVALLHADSDWYESVLLTLNTFYDRIPEGGIVVLDDFGHFEGARLAFYEFCRQRDLAPVLERVGYTQAFWRKGCESDRSFVDSFLLGVYRPKFDE